MKKNFNSKIRDSCTVGSKRTVNKSSKRAPSLRTCIKSVKNSLKKFGITPKNDYVLMVKDDHIKHLLSKVVLTQEQNKSLSEIIAHLNKIDRDNQNKFAALGREKARLQNTNNKLIAQKEELNLKFHSDLENFKAKKKQSANKFKGRITDISKELVEKEKSIRELNEAKNNLEEESRNFKNQIEIQKNYFQRKISKQKDKNSKNNNEIIACNKKIASLKEKLKNRKRYIKQLQSASKPEKPQKIKVSKDDKDMLKANR